jgi:hypothetical protein
VILRTTSILGGQNDDKGMMCSITLLKNCQSIFNTIFYLFPLIFTGQYYPTEKYEDIFIQENDGFTTSSQQLHNLSYLCGAQCVEPTPM